MNNFPPAGRPHLSTWLVDIAGNVAASDTGVAMLARIKRLAVPVFRSTEEAMEWGSRLNAEERAILIDLQRSCSDAARENGDLQRMVDLATQSQLMREAAETFARGLLDGQADDDWKR